MQPLINGIAYGSVLAISATAFSLVSGTTKGLHLAHGAVLAAGGFIGLRALTFRVGLPTALVYAALGSAVLGVIIERSVYWPLAKKGASRVSLLLASLGTYLVLAGVLALVFGQAAIFVRTPLAGINFRGVSVSAVQQIQMLSGALVSLAGFLFLRHTSAGKLFRAQADDPELLEVVGGRPQHVRLAAAAAGSGLAGMAGTLVAADIGMDANYGMAAAIAAAVACILAGPELGMRPAVAGMVLGIVQAFAGALISERWAPAATYLLLVGVLFRRAKSVKESFAVGDGV